MNLVLSGPIDDSLRNAVFEAVTPRNVVLLSARALRFEDANSSDDVATLVSTLCKRFRVDHSYVDDSLRLSCFGLLAIDMDSTLITIECIDEIADFANKKREVAAITEAAMSGVLADFSLSLQKRVALLAGLDASVLQRVYDERLTLTDGARDLILMARRAGLHTLLISGGFTYFSERLAESLSMDSSYANVLEIQGEKLTGRLKDPIIDAKGKAEILRRKMESLNLNRRKAIVIGDGSNDIPMMQLVDHSVAYHGKAAVTRAARHSIEFGSLKVVADYFAG